MNRIEIVSALAGAGALAVFAVSPYNPLAPYRADASTSDPSVVSAGTVSQLQAKARRALVAHQNIGSDYKGVDWAKGATPKQFQAEDAEKESSPTQSEGNDRKRLWGTEIANTFGKTKTAEREQLGLENALADIANPDIRDYGGGVDKIDFTSVQSSQTRVTLVADAVVWAAYAARQQGVWSYARPTNHETVTFVYEASSDGKWSLSSMTSSLVDGTAP